MSEGKDLLLVDDDHNDQTLFLCVMERLGLVDDVAIAHDGVEALEYLKKQTPECVPKLLVVDYKMPRMDGLQLLQRLREDTRLKKIPVVILTSSHDSQDVARAYAAGAHAYLLKPVKFSQFQQEVEILVKFWLQMNLVDRSDQ